VDLWCESEPSGIFMAKDIVAHGCSQVGVKVLSVIGGES
jgi:hypothetical protein